MKKIFLIASVCCVALVASQSAMAQDAVKNRAGFFLAAASGDIDEIGVGGIFEFKVGKKVTISPQLLLYFPENYGYFRHNFLEVNVNANYYFYNKDIFEFYGLGGLNFTRWSYKYDGPGNHYNNSDVEIGLNLGGGINFEVSRSVVPFSEVRLTIGQFDQFVISGGLKFNLR